MLRWTAVGMVAGDAPEGYDIFIRFLCDGFWAWLTGMLLGGTHQNMYNGDDRSGGCPRGARHSSPNPAASGPKTATNIFPTGLRILQVADRILGGFNPPKDI
jgi:hypothetical protein